MTIQQIKQRFGIIGDSPLLNRAIDIAMQVSATDLSVLITGESGTGKEIMPQIIHQLSSRKHGNYIAVNCGAIPEGTIDSELFGHEKGAFTGASDSRKGYFEVANGGTIFLDEVAELPVQTQVRLLRVLETGEFIKVGSSKVLKTNVRIVAATNVDISEAIRKGRFREDLYYRLNTVPIIIPSLRNRKEDIHLLFRKFAADFAEKYKMPTIRLNNDAVDVLENYTWPGNIRQLKNVAEQISVIEQERNVDASTLVKYLPHDTKTSLPAIIKEGEKFSELSDREILYKVLVDMKKELTELRQIVYGVMQGQNIDAQSPIQSSPIYSPFFENPSSVDNSPIRIHNKDYRPPVAEEFHEQEVVEESLSLSETEKEMIKKALEKYKGKRKDASRELGISERTLYRKIKEYNMNL